MADIFVCINTECTELDVDKPSLEPMPPETPVHCGECGDFCRYKHEDGSLEPEVIAS